MALRASRRRGSLPGVKFVPGHDELESIVRGLQSQEKVVVFTCGTFDLFHVGHLRCLRDAKNRGDFLVVGVHSDRSVRRHKHPALPVIPEKERVELLEAVDCVDYVTLYHDATPEGLLARLKPNIFAMGTDYKVSTLPARDAVLSYGGRVIIAGDSKKHSTTEIIHRVKSLRRVPAAAPRRAASPARRKKGSRAAVGAGR